jgi:hypothetical protein
VRSACIALVLVGCTTIGGIDEPDLCRFSSHYGEVTFADQGSNATPFTVVQISDGSAQRLGFDGNQFLNSPPPLALPDDVTDVADASALLLLITTPSPMFPDGFTTATVDLHDITFPDHTNLGVQLELRAAKIATGAQQETSTFPQSGTLDITSVTGRFTGAITNGVFGDNQSCTTVVDHLTFDAVIGP